MRKLLFVKGIKVLLSGLENPDYGLIGVV